MDKLQHILIDDDDLIRDVWQMASATANVALKTYDSFKSCEGALSLCSKDTVFYVDWNLAHGENGLDIARDLLQRGFTNIYLSTGMAPIEVPPGIVLGVIDKNPPWDAM